MLGLTATEFNHLSPSHDQKLSGHEIVKSVTELVWWLSNNNKIYIFFKNILKETSIGDNFLFKMVRNKSKGTLVNTNNLPYF